MANFVKIDKMGKFGQIWKYILYHVNRKMEIFDKRCAK